MTWGSRWGRRRACIRCSGRPGRIFGGSVGKSEHDTTRRCGAWRRQSRSDRASHGPRGSRRYSRKVPQQARTHGDLCTRLGTVTCADGLMWTGCRWMACKRSAVRARLAPLHGISAAQSLAELRGSRGVLVDQRAPLDVHHCYYCRSRVCAARIVSACVFRKCLVRHLGHVFKGYRCPAGSKE